MSGGPAEPGERSDADDRIPGLAGLEMESSEDFMDGLQEKIEENERAYTTAEFSLGAAGQFLRECLGLIVALFESTTHRERDP
ncbi:MAG: hypothetical protein HKN12_08685 [Gemmatimonadetes bacterium]|nr:hypothetical protein [Gemmatimonadota bacterium]